MTLFPFLGLQKKKKKQQGVSASFSFLNKKHLIPHRDNVPVNNWTHIYPSSLPFFSLQARFIWGALSPPPSSFFMQIEFPNFFLVRAKKLNN